MRGKLFLSFLLIFAANFLSAQPPDWVKSGESAAYPGKRFLAALGKGNTEKDALTDAQRNMNENISEILVAKGMEKAKINSAPSGIMKSFEKGHSYYDKADNIWYALGIVDKNMARINIEDDLYGAEQALQYRASIYEALVLPVIPRIKAVNELLELYDRRDRVAALKEALSESPAQDKTGEFEREKLEAERKRLYGNIVFYVKTENFNAGKLRKLIESKGFGIVPELPAKPVSGDKGIAVINCTVSLSKNPAGTQAGYGWMADLVLSDAFNENAVLYSNTSAGDESGDDEKEAFEKASFAAAAGLNNMAEEFFKSIE